MGSEERLSHSLTDFITSSDGVNQDQEFWNYHPSLARVHADERGFLCGLCDSIGVDKDMITPDLTDRMASLKTYDQDVTYPHSINVALITAGFGSYLNEKKGYDFDIGQLFIGGLQHDIGKLFIPHEIIAKCGRLDEEERRIMNCHTLYGGMILRSDKEVPYTIIEMAEDHHPMPMEDHPSYQRRVKDHTKILSVVDHYVAGREMRSYKDPWPDMHSITMLEGSVDDGKIDPKFFEGFKEYRKEKPLTLYHAMDF